MLALPKQARPQVSKAQTFSAPVNGWNARDPLAAMKPEDAVYLDNWWPTPTSVNLRKGSDDWVTGITGNVETLMAYNGPTGSSELFACANNNIYDVSSSGAVGPAESAGTITSNRWQYTQFVNSGGTYLVAVNGTDNLRLYNGSAWTVVTGVSSPAITGVATTDLVHVTVHKNRLWFVEDNSLSAWYLGTQAVSGAATEFDVSSQCRKGGYLVAMGTWTLDAGDGVDDYLVFVTSEGEVLVYQGTDPASAATWAIRGRWEIGNPIGRRCLLKFAGDLLIACQDGVMPLSRALISSRVNPRVALTNRIQFAMSQAATLYGINFGWEMILFPTENMLILNVPTSSTTADQFAMNTISGAWCRFQNWNAFCWEYFNEELYFGANGKVIKAWSGNDDSGNNIVADGLSAFNYFDSRRQKNFTLIRPIVAASALPPLALAVNYDFKTDAPIGLISGSNPSSSLWDSGTWDSAVWGGGETIYRAWQGARGIGFCAATRLRYEGKGYDVSWISTDYVYREGGIL